MEEGFNGLTDTREERVRSISDMATEYLENYRLRHKSITFAEYGIGHVTRHLGELLVVDVSDKVVIGY